MEGEVDLRQPLSRSWFPSKGTNLSRLRLHTALNQTFTRWIKVHLGFFLLLELVP